MSWLKFRDVSPEIESSSFVLCSLFGIRESERGRQEHSSSSGLEVAEMKKLKDPPHRMWHLTHFVLLTNFLVFRGTQCVNTSIQVTVHFS